ncbi:cobalamin biosynthesis protein [Pseudomonas putida]|uniref:Cobalamin biosynthesis protein CobE n=1 Tax=Pseudomonas putida S13.1.2 TaxID=1384061 RepID=A0AAU8RVE2_PSEPU|nr:cobalamin biosynthesis protein [Pseudomonas putida]AJQ46942.1 cobalamin biosynthesis protein CobE [Pseudomonas putida S13.1.2]
MPAFYAGFGCRRGCPADTLQTLLLHALASQGLALADLHGIATISFKGDEAGLQQLAERLGLPLVLYHSAQLQAFEPLLSHRSATAHAHSGCWGVAESAALALASQQPGSTARLLLTRQVLGTATLALAC